MTAERARTGRLLKSPLRRGRARHWRPRPAVWMLGPALALYLTFMVLPALGVILISFTKWTGMGPITQFVGLDNYFAVLVRAPYGSQFWNAIVHNLFVLFFGSLALQVPAIILALLVWRRGRSGTVFKVIFLLPFAMSPVVTAVLWRLLLNPVAGAVPAGLQAVGLGGLVTTWLGDPTWALPVVTLIGAWQSLGFTVLLYSAAMAGIPDDIVDAARLETGMVGTYWHVVLPLIRSTMITLLVLAVIFAFGYFEFIYLIQGGDGGPFYSTDVLGTLFYRVAFGSNQGAQATSYGQGAAISTVMLLLVIPASLILLRLRSTLDVSY